MKDQHVGYAFLVEVVAWATLMALLATIKLLLVRQGSIAVVVGLLTVTVSGRSIVALWRAGYRLFVALSGLSLWVTAFVGGLSLDHWINRPDAAFGALAGVVVAVVSAPLRIATRHMADETKNLPGVETANSDPH